jgi:hypothetical protein
MQLIAKMMTVVELLAGKEIAPLDVENTRAVRSAIIETTATRTTISTKGTVISIVMTTMMVTVTVVVEVCSNLKSQ